MNFGNPRVTTKSVLQEPTPEQIMYDRQKNSEYNNRNVKDNTPIITESETIWREINLFIPETIGVALAAFGGIILLFVIRLLTSSGLEAIRDLLTEQAYVEVAGLISNMNSLMIGLIAIPLVVLIGFYAYRFMVFTPRKDRYLVARVKRTGAIKLSVDKIKEHELEFERGISNKMTVNNPRKHWIENLGKPFIFLFEGDDCNADLNAMAGDISSKSKEINTVNENAISYGRRIEKYIQEQKDNLFANPMFYIMLAVLAAIVIIGFLVVKQPEQIQAMLAGGA